MDLRVGVCCWEEMSGKKIIAILMVGWDLKMGGILPVGREYLLTNHKGCKKTSGYKMEGTQCGSDM